MPRIILYTDLSSAFPLLFSLLHRNREELGRRGVGIAPLFPWLFGRVSSHQPVWRDLPAGLAAQPHLPGFLHPWFEQFVARAEQVETVLLFGREPRLEQHLELVRLLRQEKRLRQHHIEAVLILGRPACMLEQTFRLRWPGNPDEKTSHNIVASYCRYAELLKLLRRELGEDALTLLVDATEESAARPQSELARGLFAVLGCPPPECKEFLNHILCLASREARHLFGLREVRSNAWPKLSRDALLVHLSWAEKKQAWDTRPLTPPKYRELLNRQGREDRRELESLLGLSPQALDAPAALAHDTPWEPYRGLTDNVLDQFACSLPTSLALPLRQRYANDAHLLYPGQKRLARILEQYSDIAIQTPSSPKVSVLTLAYNQRDYIVQCMESVLTQKTNFPVRHVVVDHCSTDGTADVIAEYAATHPGIRPVLLSARLGGQNVRAMFLRALTPYVALCDGDDYFTDPYKLQTQVDFMEAHPECGLCFHPVKVVYEDGSGRERIYPPLEEMPRGVREFYYLADLMRVNFIQTNSVMYRWRFTEGLPDWFVPDLVPGDWYWHLLHAETGKIGFINKVMSVYRRHTASLFYASEISPKANRLKHGLSELRSYDVINKHFKGRYAKVLQPLANNVFANFLEHYMETGDNGPLTTANERFPELAKVFFSEVKVMRVPGRRS